MHTDSASIARLAAQQEITEVLYWYCRGLDRMDRALADTVWHPDGTADYGPDYRGPAAGFLDFVWPYHAQLAGHSHLVSNALIEVDDAAGTAASETYVSVWLRTRPADGLVTDLFHRGRYVDRWSRRAGVWAIDHRAYVGDLYREVTLPAEATAPPSGRRNDTDPSYAVFR
ncbi:nuclear transport factor 2 family protein [Streptomyces sp. GbtcB6]|uniref:nuclear transport factor 2 family protein n=1 Tax=Streptomyces sp. GbtcB6 TaxID=2824751 RepID=UPI001C30E699|nr:nuclear transport factor 2 family protein [Streptomyces sp. GbtcB6]